jgi:hypothetical protein
MLEKDLNLPIASAIADALLERKNDQNFLVLYPIGTYLKNTLQ